MVSEAGVAAGVRRIVAYTGLTAVNYLKQKARALDQLKESLKAGSPEDVVAKVEKLQAREKDLEEDLGNNGKRWRPCQRFSGPCEANWHRESGEPCFERRRR